MDDQASEDAQELRALRTAAGLDFAQLGAMANLSSSQVRQLEEGGDSLFYSPQIKSQAMRRVIQLLHQPPKGSTPTRVELPAQQLKASGNVIDDIVRLSEKNLKGTDLSLSGHRAMRLGSWLPWLVLLLGAAAAFAAWKSREAISVSSLTEWVKPAVSSTTETPSAEPVAAAPVISPQTPVKTEDVALAPLNTPTSPPNLVSAPTADTNTTAPHSKPASTPDSTPHAVAASPTTSTTVAPKPDKKECAGLDAEAVPVSPFAASKPPTYVYLLATQSVQLCVDDGKRNRTVVRLEAGAGRSIHGAPPWTISGQGLTSVQIYFQGSKLMLNPTMGERIVLKEQALTP